MYNHITQTKSPAINNRFSVIRQVYGSAQQKPLLVKKSAETPVNGPSGHVSAAGINSQLRKKTTSVEPPEIMLDLDYKSKSSIGGGGVGGGGYQRLPLNLQMIQNKIKYKKNSQDLVEDMVLPTYGIQAQNEVYMRLQEKMPQMANES